MKLESTAINAGKEVTAEPRDQNCQGPETRGKERGQEQAPMMEAAIQQLAVTATKSLEACLKTLLESHQWISAGIISSFVFISRQQVLGHGRDDSSRKKIRGQHGENYGLSE